MALDRNEAFVVVQRIVPRIRLLSVSALDNDFKVLVICLKVHTNIASENNAIKRIAVVTIVPR